MAQGTEYCKGDYGCPKLFRSVSNGSLYTLDMMGKLLPIIAQDTRGTVVQLPATYFLSGSLYVSVTGFIDTPTSRIGGWGSNSTS
jgi:hypothetical protein